MFEGCEELYYADYHFSPYTVPPLVADIAKAINGEFSAISCYEQLAQFAPNEDVRKQILEIRKDEIKHFHMFSQIYTSMTGKQPKPKIVEGCPSDYKAGLTFAFKDEQETVDFYLDIAEKANSPQIKERIRRAAADEQSHAVWFLYFMTSNL